MEGLLQNKWIGINKGLNRGLHPGLNSGLFHSGDDRVDPSLLSQAEIYVNPGELNFMTDASGDDPETQNESILSFKRFPDNAFTFTSGGVTNRASWVMNIGTRTSMAAWFGQLLTAGGIYNGGTTASFPFLHQSTKCKFTFYWVFRHRPNENSGTTKIFFATSNNTGGRGLQLQITGAANPGLRNVRLVINNNTAGVNAVVQTIYSYQSDDAGETVVISARVNAIGSSVNDVIGDCFVNGVFSSNITLSNALATQAASVTAPNLGNRGTNDLRFAGYSGDFIVFNDFHNNRMHQNICNFLKRKWNIP